MCLSQLPLVPTQQFALAQAMALALVETLDSYAEGFTIKWPNDIYWNHQKIRVTLTQHTLQGNFIHHSIVGVGVNVNQTQFLSDAPNPVSLFQILNHTVCRNQLLEQILVRVQHYLALLQQGALPLIHANYKQRLYLLNQWHMFTAQGIPFEGRILDVEPTGRLVVEARDGAIRQFAFKEIQYAPKNS